MEGIVIPRTKLGSQGLEVSLQGLGCMSMSVNYGPPKPEPDMIALIHHAVDLGITFFDTADAYGPHFNEILLGKAVKGIRHKVQLGTKFGHCFVDGEWMVRGDPAYVRASCEASLRRLDVDCIDLYYQHRVDTNVPIEVTVGEMKKLVDEGKVKYLGLSEVSASTIRRAHAVHPITAVQLEWSLWCREVEEDIIPTCRELGIGIVVYSPLGRGFFSAGAKVMEGTTEEDFRRYAQPRLVGDNLQNNQRLFNELQRLALKKGCTAGQLALAWVQNHGGDVVPIPGTTKLKNLEENVGALKIHLTKEESQEIESVFHGDAVSGARYSDGFAKWTFNNSETPPLASYNP